jgi:hypothetical protein
MEALVSTDPMAQVSVREITGALVYAGQPNFPAIMEKGTQLSVIKSEQGAQFITAVLAILINRFQNRFNVGQKMTDDQVVELATDLVFDYWGMKLEDFVTFFHLAGKNYFKEVKVFRLDADTIMAMLNIYEQERISYNSSVQRNLQEDRADPYREYDNRGNPHVYRASNAIKQYRDDINRLATTKKPDNGSK